MPADECPIGAGLGNGVVVVKLLVVHYGSLERDP
jgi:hypothetical protein